MSTQRAIFAAGCFWGVEAAFRNVSGVIGTRVGYSGGEWANPTYQDVCSHKTGHAEVVEVEFNPERVSFEELMTVFWSEHDPTQVNRQGPDIGSNYRSAIFYLDENQRASAQASKELEQRQRGRPIATEISPAGPFWEAEQYHQQYLEKRGLATCAIPTST